MQVGDILSKKTHARVVTVRLNETVGVAAQLMRANNVSALVVKDVVRAVAEKGAASINMKISQLISVQKLVACSSSDSLEHVRHLMNVHHIRHLPVIDDFALAGVISMRDVSSAFDDAASNVQTAA